jgi:hypothetical protein
MNKGRGRDTQMMLADNVFRLSLAPVAVKQQDNCLRNFG